MSGFLTDLSTLCQGLIVRRMIVSDVGVCILNSISR